MAHINLLNWREELHHQREQQFYGLLVVSAVLALVVVFGVHTYMAGQIDYQNSRNSYLQGEIKLVEAKIREIEELEREKQRLISKINVIESLQKNRPEVVYLFSELVETIPDGIRFSSVKQANRTVTIEGTAQSNARISSLMRNLEKSDWFRNPDLNVIQTKGSERNFTLRVTQISKGGK